MVERPKAQCSHGGHQGSALGKGHVFFFLGIWVSSCVARSSMFLRVTMRETGRRVAAPGRGGANTRAVPCLAIACRGLCFLFIEQERSPPSPVAASVREEDDVVDARVDCASSASDRQVGSKARLRPPAGLPLLPIGPQPMGEQPPTAPLLCMFGPASFGLMCVFFFVFRVFPDFS